MNTVIYNTLIDVQARQGAVEEVEALLFGMEHDNIPKDCITYCTAMKGYCVYGDLEKAFKVFSDMNEKGMLRDSIGYNTILDGCTRHNRLDLFDLVQQEMEKNKIPPTSFTLGVLIKMYGRRKQLDKAFEVVQEMPQKYNFAVNTQTKVCLLSQCVRLGALQKAVEVFDDIRGMEGGRVDASAFGMMIAAYLDAGREEDAAGLVEQAYGVRTGKPQLKHGHQLKSEKIEHVLRALRRKGLHDRVAVPLMQGLSNAGVALPRGMFGR